MSGDGENNVVTFKLVFSPDATGRDRMFDAFVQLAQSLPVKSSGLFERWHASVHFDLRSRHLNYVQLWFRFKAQPQQKTNLLNTARNALSRVGCGLGFQIGDVLEETEEQAFAGEFTGVGGSAGMPALWQQIQAATEWAAEDLRNRTTRQLPAGWFPWAHHIYENLNPLTSQP